MLFWFSVAETAGMLEAVHERWERELHMRHRAERRGDFEGAVHARRKARALARTIDRLERRLARKGVCA